METNSLLFLSHSFSFFKLIFLHRLKFVHLKFRNSESCFDTKSQLHFPNLQTSNLETDKRTSCFKAPCSTFRLLHRCFLFMRSDQTSSQVCVSCKCLSLTPSVFNRTCSLNSQHDFFNLQPQTSIT